MSFDDPEENQDETTMPQLRPQKSVYSDQADNHDPTIRTYPLRQGQTLESLVKKQHGKQTLKTTLEELYRENGLNETTAKSLRPQILKYREAHDVEDIESLSDWDTGTQRYHRKVDKPGEPSYLPDIRKAYERIKRNWPQ